MTDVACVEYTAKQSYINILFFLFSFGGGSELMRDGDVIKRLPKLERAQKYDSEISNLLVSCHDFDFLFFLLQTWHFHVSCTLVGRNVPISTLSRFQKISSVCAGTGNA